MIGSFPTRLQKKRRHKRSKMYGSGKLGLPKYAKTMGSSTKCKSLLAVIEYLKKYSRGPTSLIHCKIPYAERDSHGKPYRNLPVSRDLNDACSFSQLQTQIRPQMGRKIGDRVSAERLLPMLAVKSLRQASRSCVWL